MSGGVDGAGAPQGLSWSWELDFDALMACLTDNDATGAAAGRNGVSGVAGASGAGVSGPGVSGAGAARVGSARAGAPGAGDSGSAPGAGRSGVPAGATAGGGEAAQRAVPAGREDVDDGGVDDDGLEGLEEAGGGRLPAGVVAGLVAERLAPGPDLAAWLASAAAAGLEDRDLAVAAGAWRRVASWAQARELAAVAQIASRAAARDPDVGTGADGRPARVPASAAAEVALELTMSQYGAAGWADLAVELGWRLAGTGAALAAGEIDLARARLIAEATGMLPDATARAVEERVLPAAGGQTTGMLRAAVRRAVIAADPAGAEERRKDAERRAKVVLYPDEEHTATLAGQRLPAICAAAAMARIKAMARALKASGAGGGTDLLCAQVYIGLLLGTLPLIPPADGAPPDHPPPDADEGQDGGPGDDGPVDDGPVDDGPGGDGLADEVPADDVPPPGDADAPRGDDDDPCPGDDGDHKGLAGPGHDDDEDDGRPARDWPGLPALIPPAPASPGGARPGLLDVSLPWQVLAGISAAPGHLGRIGPITASQARRLAGCAAHDPAAEWRIIVTTPDGQAIAVTRVPRPRDGPPQPARGTRPAAGIGLVGRVTLIIPEDILTRPPPPLASGAGPGPGPPGEPGAAPGPPGEPGPGPGPTSAILRLALRAAGKAATRARAAAAADAAAGGCAHTTASPGYRPPPRLHDYITARDLTCRSPVCRQPAWRGDLDHTIPFDDGGLTCRCNLGGVCRTHHVLKHHSDWKLEQTSPGIFVWTTPSGRTFTVTPDTHPL